MGHSRCTAVILAILCLTDTIRSFAANDDPLDRWHPRYGSGSVSGLGYFDNTLFILTDGGDVIRSGTGTDWVLTQSGQTNGLRSFAAAPSQFVSVGDQGTILVSTNGVNWESRASETTVRLWDVAYGNNEFIAVGDQGTILASTDLQKWERRDPGSRANLRGIVVAAGQTIIVGREGTLLSSPDARTWMPLESPTANHLYDIAAGVGKFVAVGTNGTIVSSIDGRQWVKRREGGPILWRVTHAQGQFVAVGDPERGTGLPSVGAAWISNDGEQWERRELPFGNTMLAVGYGHGRFVAGGSDGALTVSTNGLVWEKLGFPRSSIIDGAGFAKDLFVSISEEFLHVSDDGVVWNVRSLPIQASHGSLERNSLMAEGNGTVIIGGRSGALAVSRDLIQWTKIRLEPFGNISSVVWLEDQFIVGDEFGALARSHNGRDWIFPRPVTDLPILGIARGNGRFLGVARGGAVLMSLDGDDWKVARMAPIVHSIAFGAGRFVIATGSGVAVTEDGERYVETRIPPSDGSEATYVTYANGKFLALGNGVAHSSEDGLVWKRQESPSGSLKSAAFGKDKFMLVGGSARIYQSDPLPSAGLPRFITEPGQLLTTTDRSLLLNAGVSAADGTVYQWKKNGIDVRGETNTWIFHHQATLGDSGEYSLVASNGMGVATSRTVQVMVEPRDVPLNFWHHRHSVSEGRRFKRFAHGLGTFAAIDDEGLLWLSTNGVQWVSKTLPFTNALTQVRWLNNSFLATAAGGRAAWSTNAMDWRDSSVGEDTDLVDVAWGKNLYVAVGERGSAFISPDALSWTKRMTLAPSDLNAVAYNGGEFVAVGNFGVIVSSSNGHDWIWDVSPTSQDLTAVAGGIVTVAVGEHGTRIARVGGQWFLYNSGTSIHSEVPSHFGASVSLAGVAHFAAPQHWLRFSFDGRAVQTSSATAPKQIRSLTDVGGQEVWAIGSEGVVISPATRTGVDRAENLDLTGIATDGRRTVAVGRFGAALVSQNGFDWTAVQTGASRHWHDVVYAKEKFIAVGDEGQVAISPDGESWESLRIDTMESLRVITFGKDLFVAAGSAGSVYRSRDGFAWEATNAVIPPVGNSAHRLVFGNGAFLMVSGSGLYRSEDAIAWPRISPPELLRVTFTGITWGTDQFYGWGRDSVGAYTVFSSPEGIAWKRLPSVIPRIGADLRYAGGSFLAFGRDGMIMTSNDGVHWLERETQTGWDLADIVEWNQSLIAIGQYGTILQSDPVRDSAPSIQKQPARQAVMSGGTARLEVGALGTSPLIYQWKFNGLPINGATNRVFLLPNVSPADAGQYQVEIANRFGSTLSEAVTVSIKTDEGGSQILLGARVAPSAKVELVIRAGKGLKLEIQTSQTLGPEAVWTAIGEILTSEVEHTFLDERSGVSTGARFYRVRNVQ